MGCLILHPTLKATTLRIKFSQKGNENDNQWCWWFSVCLETRELFECLQGPSAGWRQRCDPSSRHAVGRRTGCSERNVGCSHGTWYTGCLADACSAQMKVWGWGEKCPFWLLLSVIGNLWLWGPPVQHWQHGQGRRGWDLCEYLDGIHWLHAMSLVEEFHLAHLVLCTIYLILSKPHKRPDEGGWCQIEWFSHMWGAVVGDPGICRCMQTCRNAAKMSREGQSLGINISPGYVFLWPNPRLLQEAVVCEVWLTDHDFVKKHGNTCMFLRGFSISHTDFVLHLKGKTKFKLKYTNLNGWLQDPAENKEWNYFALFQLICWILQSFLLLKW